MDEPRHRPGATAARRFVTGGRVWTATPTRVVADDGAMLVVAHWPGVTCRVPASYAAASAGGGHDLRFRLVDELSSGTWQLADHVWTGTTMLTVMQPREWFSVSLLFDGADHDLVCWYVNFEVPFRRTPIGADSNDLMLDLVVSADGTRRWKDEDEYQHGRRVGAISPEQAREVERARGRATAMLDAASGPLAQGWEAWRRDPRWPAPVLPPAAETLASPGAQPPGLTQGPGTAP